MEKFLRNFWRHPRRNSRRNYENEFLDLSFKKIYEVIDKTLQEFGKEEGTPKKSWKNLQWSFRRMDGILIKIPGEIPKILTGGLFDPPCALGVFFASKPCPTSAGQIKASPKELLVLERSPIEIQECSTKFVKEFEKEFLQASLKNLKNFSKLFLEMF